MKNLLLDQLSSDDFRRLEPYLKTTPIKQHSVFVRSRRANQARLLSAGCGGLLGRHAQSGQMVEAAMVGWDGVVGASAALDGRISLSRGIIQLSGDIVICSIEGLKSVALRVQGCCLCSFAMSRPYMLRLNNQRLVSPPTMSRSGSAVGCCARGIFRERRSAFHAGISS